MADTVNWQTLQTGGCSPINSHQRTTNVSPGSRYPPPHSLTIFRSGFYPQLILSSSLSLSSLYVQPTGSKAQNISQGPGESLLQDVSVAGRPCNDPLHPCPTASSNTTPYLHYGVPERAETWGWEHEEVRKAEGRERARARCPIPEAVCFILCNKLFFLLHVQVLPVLTWLYSAIHVSGQTGQQGPF